MDSSEEPLLQGWLAYCGIFLLFALCGAGSASLFIRNFPDLTALLYIFPTPFALLCLVLFLRNSAGGIIVAPLMMAVWYIAYFGAFFADGWVESRLESSLGGFIAACVLGGFIGGVGLVLCSGLCYRRLLSAKHIFVGATLGAIFALSFLPRFLDYESNLNRGFTSTPVLSFALWEAIMGTYLYAVCVNSREKTRADYLKEMGSDPLRVTPR